MSFIRSAVGLAALACAITTSLEGKLRMEFYPNELPEGMEARLWSSDILEG